MSIPNDHLRHRNTDKDSEGLSIQDANILKISVTYCAKMIVPIVSSVVKNLMVKSEYEKLPLKGFTERQIPDYTAPQKLSDFKNKCYLNGRFPIVAQAVMRMQTPVGQYDFKDDDCE
jgi:hypothetical protein